MLVNVHFVWKPSGRLGIGCRNYKKCTVKVINHVTIIGERVRWNSDTIFDPDYSLTWNNLMARIRSAFIVSTDMNLHS